MKQAVNDDEWLDPVFLSVGQRVYRYEYIQKLRKDNLDRKRDGKKIVNFIPQAGFQEKVLSMQADVKIIGGKRGGGKAVSLDTQILTPYGYRPMGELKVGQRVIDPVSGKAENVLQIFEHHNIDLYEVTFNDGATVKCCMDHLWKIREIGNTRNKSNPTDDIDAGWSIWTFAMVKKWLDEQAQGKHQGQGRKFHLQIPLTNPVEFNYKGASKAHLPYIDPYVIGALLGDGCITDDTRIDASARFCTNDDEIAEQFRLAGIDMSHEYHYKSQTFAEYHIRDKRLEQILDYCGLYGTNSSTKFIPDYYKFASASDRLALLQGLLDTDGWANSTNGKVGFCSISKRLAEDVRWIVESLGGLATIYTSKSSSTKDGVRKTHGDKYEVYIKMPNSSQLFRLKRKAELCKPFNGGRGKECRNIVSYRYIGKEDARCITVSGINRLFLVNDFIVTHNTWIGLFEFLPYIFNPDVSGFGFRKFEDDIARGIWKSSKQVFKGFGSSADSFFEWKFLNGRGATFKCEHLQDPKKISDRFRGVELAYILIEELAEHTRDSMDTLFDLLASNRSTAGVQPKCICTCNPVGKSNKLRYFLDWYIDPNTDTIIPERDGKIRYFYRYGSDVTQIAWGNTWEEVYNNPVVTDRIDRLCEDTGQLPEEFITSLVFIEGNFADNEILHVSDPKYMNRIAARGGESTTNDIVGVWRDIDSGTGLLSVDDVMDFYENSERRDGNMRASADVALTGDMFFIYALDGHHVQDLDAWQGAFSDEIIPFVENFLRRNGVRKENFTFDANGLGLWIAKDSRFTRAVPFNNKSASTDPRLWNNLKSEAAEKFVQGMKNREYSIDPNLLNRTFTDGKGHKFTFKDRFMVERMALKRKDDAPRFEIISKPQMKLEIGHSPDLIEGLMMVSPMFEKQTHAIRRGFDLWQG